MSWSNGDEVFVGEGQLVVTPTKSIKKGATHQHLNALRGQMDQSDCIEGDGDALLKKAWLKMRRDSESTSLATFEGFLGGVLEELREVRWEQDSLQKAVLAKTEAQEEQLSRLFQEVETTFQEERERILREERRHERVLRLEVEKELSHKDSQLQDILQMQQELAENLKQLNATEAKIKEENLKLRKEKEDLEQKVEIQQSEVSSLQAALQRIHHDAKGDRRQRALEVLRASEGVALERESLVKQLGLLRAINAQLMDEKDVQKEMMAHNYQRNSGSFSSMKDMEERRISQMSSASDYCSMSSQAQGLASPANEVQHHYSTDDEEVITSCTSHDTAVKTAVIATNNHSSSLLEELKTSASECDNAKGCTDEVSLSGCSAPLLVQKGVFPITSQSEEGSASSSDADISDVNTPDVYDTAGLRVRRRTSIRRASMVSPTMSMTRAHGRNSLSRDSIPCPQRVFKIVVIGDSSVGKSSFIHRFCQGHFQPSFTATLGVDFHMKTVMVGDRTVCLQIWDTAGQERYHSITAQYYRKADGVLVVYDVTSEESFKHIRHWISCVKDGAGDSVLVLVVGNKADQSGARVVSELEASKVAEHEGVLFMEASAKTGKCVNEAFQIVASLLRERQDVDMAKASVLSGVHPRPKKSCC